MPWHERAWRQTWLLLTEAAFSLPVFVELVSVLLPLGLLVALLIRPPYLVQLAAVLLPMALLALAAFWAVNLLWGKYKYIGPGLRLHWKRIVIIGAIFLFILIDLPYLTREYFDHKSEYQKYWLQTLTGNWSPENVEKASINPYGYSSSVIFALILNNSLYLAIVGILWTLSRRKPMDRADVLVLQRTFIINEMKKAIRNKKEGFSKNQQERIINILSLAFRDGTQVTRDVLEEVNADAVSDAGIVEAEHRARPTSPTFS